MKYYKDQNTNELYAYEVDGSQDALIKDGLVPVSSEEAILILSEKAMQLQTQWNIENVQLVRQQAYEQEADPLFFRAQRGEIPEQEWLDKIEEIKKRYPKP